MKKTFLVAVVAGATLLRADSFSFIIYNDFFGGKDGHFTNGASLKWLESAEDGKNEYTSLLHSLTQKLSISTDNSKRYNAGINLEQIIVTPNDTQLTVPQYDDLPYAGYLSVSSFLFEWDEKSFNEYAVEIGVMGKYSGAEIVQKTFHKIIGSKQPLGWDTQLGTRFTLNLLLQHGVKSWEGKIFDSFESDWFNHYGVTVGNYNVSAFAGSIMRIGQNYAHNFNGHYPFLKGEANLLGDTPKQGLGWSTSMGIETKILAYSAILDGAIHEGYSIHKNVLNAMGYVSGSLYYSRHKFRLFYEVPSSCVKEAQRVKIIGGFEYSYKF